MIATDVPPAAGPKFGDTPVTVGPCVYTYRSADVIADVPPGVVIVTSTVVFAVPVGAVAVIVVSLTTTTEVALFAPNFTDVAPVKPDPEIVTGVVATAGPDDGATDETAGGGT